MFWSKPKIQPEEVGSLLKTDIHSHLIPKLDDGSSSMEETIQICQLLKSFGYKSAITTPHVMQDAYQVTTEKIKTGVNQVNETLKKENIAFELLPSAEYYADEYLFQLLKEKDILPFGSSYLLFELSYLNKPKFLNELVFEIQTNGYTPVLAHPERYPYLYEEKDFVTSLKNRGVLFQVNINSFLGVYSKQSKNFAHKLWKDSMIDFLGTDCHSLKQARLLKKSLSLSLLNSTEQQGILNNKL